MNADVHAISPVVDPALGRRTRWWVRRLIARRTWPANKLVIEYLGPIALAICVLGAFVSGLADPWLLAVAALAGATLMVRREVRFAGLRRFRRSFVESSDLDDASARRLSEAQDAIKIILTADVYRTGALNCSVREVDLRRHEWEIASRLRCITERRAECAAILEKGVPGPRSAAILRFHSHAVAVADAAIAQRAQELRCFASEVRQSDLARQDLSLAEILEQDTGKYQDLMVATAADDHEVVDLSRVAKEEAQARVAYQDALDRVMQASVPFVPSSPADAA